MCRHAPGSPCRRNSPECPTRAGTTTSSSGPPTIRAWETSSRSALTRRLTHSGSGTADQPDGPGGRSGALLPTRHLHPSGGVMESQLRRSRGRGRQLHRRPPVDRLPSRIRLSRSRGGGCRRGGQPAAHRSLAADRGEILPGETVMFTATASDPDGDPLTYEWSTTSGRVTGTGSTATLDFAGTTPPGSATVTVRVSDGRGGIASADATVAVPGFASGARGRVLHGGSLPEKSLEAEQRRQGVP